MAGRRKELKRNDNDLQVSSHAVCLHGSLVERVPRSDTRDLPRVLRLPRAAPAEAASPEIVPDLLQEADHPFPNDQTEIVVEIDQTNDVDMHLQDAITMTDPGLLRLYLTANSACLLKIL